ncbi:MAG: histidine kinase [Candidatus Aminicenantes bacterium]|nr:histidine kinase [Candidatus Aminicenantes bacterium]
MKTEAEQYTIKSLITSRVFQHLLFWTFFFVFLSVTPEAQALPFWQLVWHNLGHIAVLIPPVYAHFFILEKYFLNRRYGIYFALLLPVVAVSSLAANFIFREYFAYKGGFPGSLYFISFTLVISTSAKLIKKAGRQRIQIKDIESKQLRTELDLLKAQINPHFLFNTLNNLFGMARNQDKSTAEGIAHLSHLMRYMIHESQSDRVDLDKEIEQINRLIKLQKLRFSEEDAIAIDFNVKGETQKTRIPPMLLIPFIENAFKHGISLRSPSFVDISMTAGVGRLEFSVINSIHEQGSEFKESDTGQGLRNVRRRLELLFPKNHKLKIEASENTFSVLLTISL